MEPDPLLPRIVVDFATGEVAGDADDAVVGVDATRAFGVVGVDVVGVVAAGGVVAAAVAVVVVTKLADPLRLWHKNEMETEREREYNTTTAMSDLTD